MPTPRQVGGPASIGAGHLPGQAAEGEGGAGNHDGLGGGGRGARRQLPTLVEPLKDIEQFYTKGSIGRLVFSISDKG